MIGEFRIHEKDIFLNGYSTEVRADGRLSIGPLDSILRFLRLYGHRITRLEFDSVRFDDVSALKIGQYIEKYCANTLIVFGLTELTTFSTEPVNFPKLKAISIAIIGNQSEYRCGFTFGHLESIEINFRRYELWLGEIIEQNIELRSIAFIAMNSQNAAEYLKHMKKLNNLNEIRVNEAVSNGMGHGLLPFLNELQQLQTIGVYIWNSEGKTMQRDSIIKAVGNRWLGCATQIQNFKYDRSLILFIRDSKY